jgi:hypothetical protein
VTTNIALSVSVSVRSQQSNRSVSTDRYDSNHARAIAAPSRLVLDTSALSSTSIITKDVCRERDWWSHVRTVRSPKGSRSGSALGPHGRRPGATPGQCAKVFSTFPDGQASQTWKLEGINFICSLEFGSAQIYPLYLSGKATNIVRVLVVFGGAVIRITSGTSVTFQFCSYTMQWQLQPEISWRLTFNFYRSHWR